jgi:putative oxidoreductase
MRLRFPRTISAKCGPDRLPGPGATLPAGRESKPVQDSGVPENSMKVPFLIGRMIFGGFFIYNGIHHFTSRKQISQYVAAKNVPLPELAVTGTGAGTSILLGVKPKYGAAALAGFLLGVSPVMHDFWRSEDPGQRMNEVINFTKNLALAGAALALTAIEEPWPASLPVAQPKPVSRVRRFARGLRAA